MTSQVEAIELVNDGTGLGFGIIGGRSSGVVVKTIVPGSISDRDGRLQSGDHILQIGDVNLRGMSSGQAGQVLRQAGTHIRLIVARPVESSSDELMTDMCEEANVASSDVQQEINLSTEERQTLTGFGPQMWRHGGRRRWRLSQWRWR